jgi:hypothetical protein
MTAVRDVLSTLPHETWARIAEPPPEFSGSLDEQPMTVRACVLHAVEHSALHLGHIQLTRSLLSQASSGQATG